MKSPAKSTPKSTRADVADDVKVALGCSDAHAQKAVAAVLDSIAARAKRGERVELRGLATFETRHKKARSGRNITTGAVIAIFERDVVCAKASRSLSKE